MRAFDKFDYAAVQAHTDEVKQFLDQFAELCYAVGGPELVQSVQTEMEYHIGQGHELTDVIGDVYDNVKRNIPKGNIV